MEEENRETGKSLRFFDHTYIFNKFYQEPYGTFNTKNFSKIFGKIWVVIVETIFYLQLEDYQNINKRFLRKP